MLILLFLSVATAANFRSKFDQTNLKNKFEVWKSAHGKTYSPSEYIRRMSIYIMNSRLIKDADVNFELSLDGPFADLTNEEYRAMLKLIHVEVNKTFVKTELKNDVPDALDWRTYGKVTAIRDQAQCGSCYSFGATAAIESRLLISGSKFTVDELDLSEQQIVDCSDKNNGCNGGSMVFTYYYIARNGQMLEKDYPYTGKDGSCAYDSSKVAVKISGQKIVTSGSEDALKNAVAEGPVAVGIDASNFKFQLYKSGIYDDPKCSSTNLDHGVACVGYGSENGVDFWIVRNSWGSSWGDNGYIKMVRNKNNQCGIATAANYPVGVVDA